MKEEKAGKEEGAGMGGHMCSQECGCGSWRDNRGYAKDGPTGKPTIDIIEQNWEEFR